MVFLGLIIVIVHVDPELDFFNGDRLLVLLCLPLFLFLLIQEFPVIHDAADGRVRGGRNFNQIQVLFSGSFQRFEGRQDSDLLALIINHAYFTRANALVHADKAFIDKLSSVHNRATEIHDYTIRAGYRPRTTALAEFMLS